MSLLTGLRPGEGDLLLKERDLEHLSDRYLSKSPTCSKIVIGVIYPELIELSSYGSLAQPSNGCCPCSST